MMMARHPEIGLERLRPTMPAFMALMEESRREGFWMLVRLHDGWTSRRNQFRKRGEALYGAWTGGELAGVCGLNVDPYFPGPGQGRVRHLYVRPASRRHGVGRRLVETVIEKAAERFTVLNLRAPAEAFAFYEALGFLRVENAEFLTHRMVLSKPPPGHI
jgi:GNAT superfamily N-acetyltransferase